MFSLFFLEAVELKEYVTIVRVVCPLLGAGDHSCLSLASWLAVGNPFPKRCFWVTSSKTGNIC